VKLSFRRGTGAAVLVDLDGTLVDSMEEVPGLLRPARLA